MQVQVHYQGMESSQWIDQFISRKLDKLNRYLSPASVIHIHLKFANRMYSTTMEIHNPIKDYAFSSNGENLYESFSSTMDKASRALGEQKRKLKDKINARFFSLKKDMLPG